MNKKNRHPIAIGRKTKLRHIIPSRNASTFELAELIGHGSSAKVVRIESGYEDPDEDDLKKFAEVFRTKPALLMKQIEDWRTERDSSADEEPDEVPADESEKTVGPA